MGIDFEHVSLSIGERVRKGKFQEKMRKNKGLFQEYERRPE